MYTALTPAANEITKLGLDATDLPTHIASAAQGQVSVHPVVDSVLALGRQPLTRDVAVGQLHVMIIYTDAARVTLRSMDNVASTDRTVGRLAEHANHHPSVTFTDIMDPDFVVFVALSTVYSCHQYHYH